MNIFIKCISQNDLTGRGWYFFYSLNEIYKNNKVFKKKLYLS